jgi:hypothetical protein
MRRKSHGAVEEGNARAGGRHRSQHTPNSLSQQRKWQRNSKKVQKKNDGTQSSSVLHCLFAPPAFFLGSMPGDLFLGEYEKRLPTYLDSLKKKLLNLLPQ